MGCCPPGEQGRLNCYVVCNVVFGLTLIPSLVSLSLPIVSRLCWCFLRLCLRSQEHTKKGLHDVPRLDEEPNGR